MSTNKNILKAKRSKENALSRFLNWFDTTPKTMSGEVRMILNDKKKAERLMRSIDNERKGKPQEGDYKLTRVE